MRWSRASHPRPSRPPEESLVDPPRPHPDWPLVVAYGLGVNSTAMLVEFAKKKIVPDLILFADTGGEKPETYRYLPVIDAYLKEVKFPPVVTVRYEPRTAPYRTLEGSACTPAPCRRSPTAGRAAPRSGSGSPRTPTSSAASRPPA